MQTSLKTKVIIQKSFGEIVSNQFLDNEHMFVKGIQLKGNQKALGVKYSNGDKITNMEGAFHTFVTPIINFVMTGDYVYKYGHGVTSFNGKTRNLVMSAAIQPDFEYDNVMLPVVKLSKEKVEGKEIDFDNFKLFHEYETISKEEFYNYEEALKRHLIYHLTKDHHLPSYNDIKVTPMNSSACIETLENIINNETDINLYDKYSVMGDNEIISLECLFNVYVEQIRNEMSVFESNLNQGYIYTINPPRIFASEIGQNSVPILNRLQILAFKHLGVSSFKNMKGIGFDGFADSSAISLYKKIFEGCDVQIQEKNSLLDKDGIYSSNHKYALIVHNNSDAFGENIKYEGVSSLDGAIGCYSNAACCLDCKRKDIADYIM